jgi:hypothetical protein
MNEVSKNRTEKLTRNDVELSRTGVTTSAPMRLPFFDPPRDEVAAVASDLIIRFGLDARDEALFLAGLSEQMRARWNSQLYRLAAHEIEMSFAEARRRLGVEDAPKATG